MKGYTAFDRFVAHRRYVAALPHLKKGARVCDLGCGPGAPFLEYAKSRVGQGIGIDDVRETSGNGHWKIVVGDITKPLPLPESGFDHVTMLAVLEHLPSPEPVLREAFRVLAPGGSLIMTWPQGMVDPMLKFFSRLGMVADEMGFEEHQKRIPLADLQGLLRRIGFTKFYHRRFELGLNNLLVAEKSAEAGTQMISGSDVTAAVSRSNESHTINGGE
jgi:ubiquinone/menaquinone biosynthesis C-methylase UbiE